MVMDVWRDGHLTLSQYLNETIALYYHYSSQDENIAHQNLYFIAPHHCFKWYWLKEFIKHSFNVQIFSFKNTLEIIVCLVTTIVLPRSQYEIDPTCIRRG